ncbi:hypothetical protein [Rhizobium sp. FY34]|uniref:hypothetical protein n=1 Tax=Rhizobium sp. FY34 TaxID=2562309 RepID=UPI0010C03FEB|nr:hypothetical protein [Rhizobium sp. FY34]
MAMSKEERAREDWIYENEPHINGLTEGQFDRLPPDERDRHCQILMQVPATVLGYWKTCDLSVCRRAKQCRGFLSKAQIERGGYNRAYPPCTGPGGRRQGEMLKALDECEHLFDAQMHPLLGKRKSGA